MVAGGKAFGYIPCLNDQHEWVAALAAITIRHRGGWDDAMPAEAELDASRQRAVAAGAAR